MCILLFFFGSLFICLSLSDEFLNLRMEFSPRRVLIYTIGLSVVVASVTWWAVSDAVTHSILICVVSSLKSFTMSYSQKKEEVFMFSQGYSFMFI